MSFEISVGIDDFSRVGPTYLSLRGHVHREGAPGPDAPRLALRWRGGSALGGTPRNESPRPIWRALRARENRKIAGKQFWKMTTDLDRGRARRWRQGPGDVTRTDIVYPPEGGARQY